MPDSLRERNLMNVFAWLDRLPGKYHITIGLLLTAVLGYFDYRTGYKLRMELFYLVPISYVTWFRGGRLGVLFAILSIVTTVYADIRAGKHFTQFGIEIWNAATYFVFYLIVTVLLKLRKTVQQRESLIEELDRALKQNEELSRLLPVCTRCGKFRDDPEYRQLVASYAAAHMKPELPGGLCKECAARR